MKKINFTKQKYSLSLPSLLGGSCGLLCASLALLTVTYSSVVFSEVPSHTNSLSKAMWSFVQACDAKLKSEGEYGSDVKVINNIKNGYLHLSGSYPTCGCACSTSVGAYSKKNGNYSFLKYETWSCQWSASVSSQNNLRELLPHGFGLQTFVGDKNEVQLMEPTPFHLKVEVPNIGTDTVVDLSLIPLGLNMSCEGGLCFSTSENKDSTYEGWIDALPLQVKDRSTLSKVAKGEWDSILAEDKKIIDKLIQSCDVKLSTNCATKESMQKNLNHLLKVFDFYNGLKYTRLILGWDKSLGRFYIKNKMKPEANKSFYDFIKTASKRIPTC